MKRSLIVAAVVGGAGLLAPYAAYGSQPPSFRQQISGTGDVLKGVSASDACHVWAVAEPPGIAGSPSTILATTNGGKTWKAQLSGLLDTTLNRVQFVDNREGWVVGEEPETNLNSFTPGAGVILHTSNGGKTWGSETANAPQPPSGDISEYEGLSFVNRDDGWLIQIVFDTSNTTISSSILHTTDGGKTFTTQYTESGSSMADVSFVDKLNGWAVDDSGNILHTSNGGVAGLGGWAIQTTKSSSFGFERVRFFDTLHGVAAGDIGILWTNDGGATWNTSTLPVGLTPNINLNDIAWVDTSHVGVVGDVPASEGSPPTILLSLDGGTTFSSVSAPVSQSLNGVTAIPHTTQAWAVGESGTIIASGPQSRCGGH